MLSRLEKLMNQAHANHDAEEARYYAELLIKTTKYRPPLALLLTGPTHGWKDTLSRRVTR